jgi:hypothetical protein
LQPPHQVADFTLTDSNGSPLRLSAYKRESGPARLLGGLAELRWANGVTGKKRAHSNHCDGGEGSNQHQNDLLLETNGQPAHGTSESSITSRFDC